MDFLTLAKSRWSLRKFSDKAIQRETLDKILEAGRTAPTAVNYQPQRILVLDADKNREKLEKCTKYAFNAPLFLIVCYDSDISWKRSYDNADFGMTDAAIVITHMLLAAAECGVGSCWVGSFDPTALINEFDIPSNFVPAALIPLGYPAEGAHPAHLHEKRLDLSETVFFGKF